MTKRITVLGSTGSLGKQTLDVAAWTPGVSVAALAALHDIDTLEGQVRAFRPELAAVADEKKASELAARVKGLGTEVLGGPEGVLTAASYGGADMVVNAIVGFAGLWPTVAAIKAGKDVALANKETLVAAGSYVMKLAAEKGVAVLPVDGEHSAVFQCLRGNERNAVSRLILTASGGPFRGYTKERLKSVTLAGALRHPTWKMGMKITVDSASMMNKGLEVIEAHFLFDVPPEKIQVLVHPQSVVHSMVEFADASVMAQLAVPDMRLPIQYAINYPKRAPGGVARLDLAAVGSLTFEEPDNEAFPCLELAYGALKEGGAYPAVLNAANEAAAGFFLAGVIGFTEIPVLIERALLAYNVKAAEPFAGDWPEGLLDQAAADGWARDFVVQAVKEM